MRKLRAFSAIRVTAGAVIISFALTGCSAAGRQIYFSSGTGVSSVFRIGRFKCPKSEARVYLLNYRNIYGRSEETDLFNADISTEGLDKSIRNAALEHLSEVYALKLYAGDHKIALDSQENDRVSEAAKKYYESLTDDEKKYIGADEDDIREMYENLAVAMKVYNKLIGNVSDKVSEDEARVADCEMIVTKKKENADRAYESAKNGVAFSELSQYSDKPSITAFVKRGELPSNVEKTVFSMENGETSGLIKGEDGKYYIIKCISKFDKKLSESNKMEIVKKRQKKQIKKIISTLDKKYYSELNTKRWNGIKMPDSGKLKTDSFFSDLNDYISYQ